MSKVKYRFNPDSLSYEEVNHRNLMIRKFISHLATGLVFAVLIFLAASYWIDSDREKILKRENKLLETEYEKLLERMEYTSQVVTEVQQRDDDIYRSIFGTEPVKSNFSSPNKYAKVQSFNINWMLSESEKYISKIEKESKTQQKSAEELFNLVKNKSSFLPSFPCIQPIFNKDLKYMPYGFGNRLDPIFKTQQFHRGIDFAIPEGTKVYATADGVISIGDESRTYGKHLKIEHQNGFSTLYANLSKILVKSGQKVKRGDNIALSGNTGKSVTPHLHYEISKNGELQNPVHFLFADITAEQYHQILIFTSRGGLCLD